MVERTLSERCSSSEAEIDMLSTSLRSRPRGRATTSRLSSLLTTDSGVHSSLLPSASRLDRGDEDSGDKEGSEGVRSNGVLVLEGFESSEGEGSRLGSPSRVLSSISQSSDGDLVREEAETM